MIKVFLVDDQFGINLNLNTLEYLVDKNPDRARAILQQLKSMVQEVQTEMRLMIYELKPLNLQGQDFFEAIDSLLSLYRVRYSLNINSLLRGDNHTVDEGIQLVLYRVIQEALNNIVKHARASSVNLTLVMDSKWH